MSVPSRRARLPCVAGSRSVGGSVKCAQPVSGKTELDVGGKCLKSLAQCGESEAAVETKKAAFSFLVLSFFITGDDEEGKKATGDCFFKMKSFDIMCRTERDRLSRVFSGCGT